MINRENGFTYPLTLCLLLVFLVFLTMQVDQLLMERKLAHESATIQQEEYYFLSSIKKVEALYQTVETIPLKGGWTFSNGTMEYQAEAPTGGVQKVTFNLVLNTGIAVTGRGSFDVVTKKLTKWTEVK
ncbi:competence type IV pilus minor pilin ComGG [Bacillus sp. 1P10SD]|uniref:competence type IV pilus minor pilin ComGG n=1 Tax=Bacillus sp. 1P10SD TaxID=3132265 RepID=UPI0039A6DE8B